MDPVLSSIIHEYGPAALPLIGLLLIWSRIVAPELRANRAESSIWKEIAGSLKETALINQRTAMVLSQMHGTPEAPKELATS